MKKLYLDDVRCPKTEGWDIVRTYEDFVDWITKNGLPNEVSFDHDIAEIHYDPSTQTEGFKYYDPSTQTEGFKYYEKTGYDAAKWMCGYCMENGLPIPEYNCHSANPVGRENILAILDSHKEKLNY